MMARARSNHLAPAPVVVTWNPSDKSANVTLSDGNLRYTKTAGARNHDGSCRATIGKSSGKWYWEVNATDLKLNNAEEAAGIAKISALMTQFIGGNANSWCYLSVNGQKYTNGSGAALGPSYVTGDVLMVALDMNDGKVWFGKNGVWQPSPAANPATGATPAYSGLTGTIYPACGAYDLGVILDAKFASASWTYSAPSGFLELA